MPPLLISMRSAFIAAMTVFVLLIALPVAYADTSLYKYTGSDGIAVYTQTLPENYRPSDVQAITIETLPIEQQRAARRMLAVMEKRIDAKLAARHTKLVKADQQISIAIKHLQQAESNLKNGAVPSAVELIGKVGGGTRLRATYFLRVSHLQLSVEQAKHALDAAYRERNDLR